MTTPTQSGSIWQTIISLLCFSIMLAFVGVYVCLILMWCAVIASSVGGLRSLIARNGVLLRDASPSCIAVAIQWLASHPELRREFVARAAVTVKNYGPDVAQAYLSIYGAVLQGK